MESAFERIARLLLAESRKDWTGVELSERAGCSTAMTSRVLKRLEREAVVARPFKNRIALVEPVRLLVLWSCQRTMPEAVYVKSSKTENEVDRVISEMKHVALTQYRAAWLRTQYMKTRSYELYVRPHNLTAVADRLGKRTEDPQLISLLPTEDHVFAGSERIGGLPVVSVPQNFVDLMCAGGSGPRVALQLGLSTGLLKV